MESSESDKDHPRATELLATQEDENDRTTALRQYANTVVKAGDYDAAIGMYEQALEIIPGSYASQNFERRLQQLQAQKSNEAEKEPG